jgi:hypothetical protein
MASEIKCQLCDHRDVYLGDHILEVHGNLSDYCGPLGSTSFFREFEDSRKAVERKAPDLDHKLTTEFCGLTWNVNTDVPEEDCLPIPPHYRVPQHGQLAIDYQDALLASMGNNSVYIYGVAGSGKDSLFHALSGICRIPGDVYAINPEEYIQPWLYREGISAEGNHWIEGRLLKQLRDGYTTKTGRKIPYFLLFTDVDRATSSQLEILRMILDTTQGRVQGPEGKMYDVFPGTQIVFTANTTGNGSREYASARLMDESMKDRIDSFVEFHWMDWLDEIHICKAKFPLLAAKGSDSFWNQIGKCVETLRREISEGNLRTSFSHRAVCRWLRQAEKMLKYFGELPEGGLKRAMRVALDEMSNDTRQDALTLIDAHLQGGALDISDPSLKEEEVDDVPF